MEATSCPYSVSSAIAVIESIYAKCLIDGYAVSRTYKAQQRAKGCYELTESLTYGEIDIQSFIQEVLLCIHVSIDGSFFDIGSGTGKAVFAASCCMPYLTKFVGYVST